MRAVVKAWHKNHIQSTCPDKVWKLIILTQNIEKPFHVPLFPSAWLCEGFCHLNFFFVFAKVPVRPEENSTAEKLSKELNFLLSRDFLVPGAAAQQSKASSSQSDSAPSWTRADFNYFLKLAIKDAALLHGNAAKLVEFRLIVSEHERFHPPPWLEGNPKPDDYLVSPFIKRESNRNQIKHK